MARKHTLKLAAHVEIERGLRSIYGKSKAFGGSGAGATPAPYDPIPDYQDIWYQPDGDPRKEDETAARLNRRKAVSVANKGKYGFHGTADANDTPILRYDAEDYPQNEIQRAPSPNRRREVIVTPNKYPQTLKTGPIKHSIPKGK